MRIRVALVAPAIAIACGAQTVAPPAPAALLVVEGRFANVLYAAADAAAAQAILRYANEEAPALERSLSATLGSRFAVRLFPARDLLTAYWREQWRQPSLAPECWMIGSASLDTIALLSPRAWLEWACGHDPADEVSIRRIVKHEIVHVLHRRAHGSAGFVNQQLWWFVEGLAVTTSGQLDAAAQAQVRSLGRAGRLPTRFDHVLASGYSVAGSLAAFIVSRWPATLESMMRVSTNVELMAVLGTDEQTLFREWSAAEAK